MNIIKRIFVAYLMLLSFLSISFAQEVGSDSPYSRYGYGILSNPAIGASASMGGIGYGVRRSQHVNPANPASYSRLDTLTFVFDIGVSGQNNTLYDGTNRNHLWNGNLEYIAMQFPIIRNVGASIGLLPYSKVGYNFGRVSSVDNASYSQVFKGSGGLSQVYGGVAYTPVKQLSIGANIAYLFGNIQHTRSLPPVSNTASLYRIRTDRFSIRDIKFDIGAQFTYPIDKFSSATIGLVYTPKISSHSKPTVFDALYASTATSEAQQILQNDTLDTYTFEQPASYGLGVSYSNRNLLVGIDGTFQQWKNVNYPAYLDKMTDESRFNNRLKINTGIEYVKDRMSRSFFSRIRYRAGLSYSNSYINTVSNGGNSFGGYKEYGATIGLGLPFRDNFSGRLSMLNIGFGYSRLQPDNPGMITEDLYKISINMNINEYWFFKQLFN